MDRGVWQTTVHGVTKWDWATFTWKNRVWQLQRSWAKALIGPLYNVFFFWTVTYRRQSIPVSLGRVPVTYLKESRSDHCLLGITAGTSRRAAKSGSCGSLAQHLTVLAAVVNHNQKGKKESKIRSGHYYGKKNHLQEHILPHIALYKLDVKNGLN